MDSYRAIGDVSSNELATADECCDTSVNDKTADPPIEPLAEQHGLEVNSTSYWHGYPNEVDTVEECDDTSDNERALDTPSKGLTTTAPQLEPYVGMEFKSADDAREYYDAYGRHNGFTIRVNRKRRSRVDHEVIGYDYVCSKEGFRRKRNAREKIRAKQTRVGCKAILVIAYRRDVKKWVVTNFLREHNHELMVPSEVPVRIDKGELNEDEKDRRIRELTTKLYNERSRFQRQCAAYEEQCEAYRVQIVTILNDIEGHNNQLTKKVNSVVQCIKEFEDEDSRQERHCKTD